MDFLPKPFKVHKCADGGVLYEIYKREGFGQLVIRTVLPGITVGGHLHPQTHEWWLIFDGEAVVYLERVDGIREMRRARGDNPKIIEVPAGTGHGIKNVGEGELAFLFFADRVYDPEKPDKKDWIW